MLCQKKVISKEVVKELCSRYACDPLTASIFARRDIVHGVDIQYYLEQDLRYLHSPFLLPSMEDAVDRILTAKDEGEKVLIFGDRDVDGIILKDQLKGIRSNASTSSYEGLEMILKAFFRLMMNPVSTTSWVVSPRCRYSPAPLSQIACSARRVGTNVW